MLDQATELRKLVLRSVREPPADGSPSPPLLVVCGGCSGVGVTTLSIHLAVALSGQGCRVVLVDADLHRPRVASACGLSGEAGIAEVLAARRDIHEVLQPGPGGVQVIAGRASAGHPADWGEVAQQRLLRQLKKLGRHADVIALDAGSGGHESAEVLDAPQHRQHRPPRQQALDHLALPRAEGSVAKLSLQQGFRHRPKRSRATARWQAAKPASSRPGATAAPPPCNATPVRRRFSPDFHTLPAKRVLCSPGMPITRLTYSFSMSGGALKVTIMPRRIFSCGSKKSPILLIELE